MCAETYLQYTEQNGTNNNVAFGIMSGVATGALVTGSAGIRATGTFIGIYKKAGDTAWRAHAQNPSGATPALDTLSASPCGLSTYQRLSIDVMVQQGNFAEIAYRVDGVPDAVRDGPVPGRRHQAHHRPADEPDRRAAACAS